MAERLGEPEGTVKSRIRNGLKNLGRLLGDLHHDVSHAPTDSPSTVNDRRFAAEHRITGDVTAQHARTAGPTIINEQKSQKRRWGR